MKIIYFIASFGDFNRLPLGGGQTSSRRMLATLRRMEYEVIPIHRHPPTSRNRIIRNVQFLFWTLVDPIASTLHLLFCTRKNSIVLYQGYLGKVLLPLEYAVSLATRLLGYHTVFYLKGGGTEQMYRLCNGIQKHFERRLLENYKLVMCEGHENILFVNGIADTHTEYLPNFTEDGFAPATLPQKPADRWNLFYFGRISPSKNVLLTIDVFDLLCQHYGNMHLTIVGGGPDDYCQQVEERIAKSPNSYKIERIGRSSHDALKQMMAGQHFFLFPSNEPREGHSNALNEAMSFGLVPIVSTNNFLPSIVANDRLVAKELTATAFADIITDVIETDDFASLSKAMFERVQQNFTQAVVEEKLRSVIESFDNI